MCVSSLFINSIKVYRIYNCRPYPWLTYLYTVATMMGHGHNEHNTNNRIRYSGHYPKDISPSLVPSSACQRRAFSYITQPLSLLTVISPNYHWSIVQILKKNWGGPTPVPPLTMMRCGHIWNCWPLIGWLTCLPKITVTFMLGPFVTLLVQLFT